MTVDAFEANKTWQEQWNLVDFLLESFGLNDVPKEHLREFHLDVTCDRLPMIRLVYSPRHDGTKVMKQYRLRAE